MNQQEQLKTIKSALELEVCVESQSQELSELLSEKFDEKPDPPTAEVIKRFYPEIVPTTKFNWALAIIPCIIFLPWIIIYYYIYKEKRKVEVERIQNSDQHKQEIEDMDRNFDKKQAEADALYREQTKEYDEEILPRYQKELAQWTENMDKKIAIVEGKLNEAQNALSMLYETTKIVPVQYRKIEALKYIYDIISTSEYDVKYAIDIYDRNEQRKLDEMRLQEQQRANILAEDQNVLLEDQNYLAQEQNEIAEKARRDANIASVAATVQRRNINKNIKKSIKK